MFFCITDLRYYKNLSGLKGAFFIELSINPEKAVNGKANLQYDRCRVEIITFTNAKEVLFQ